MHYSQARTFTHMSGEIDSLYHEAAVRIGVSDSVLNILYIVCEKGGQCFQSDIFRLTGMSRQTINSSIRNLEKSEIVYLEQGIGRNTIVYLTEKGKRFTEEKIRPLFEIENRIWQEWTAEEQEIYLTLTQKYRDTLKKYMKEIG
ncbi:MAG: winged helix-turn-helix transcriptional regulator [Clostridia bacterium]|nr:winged helix-turn-helix transcriptional regulator [Clostridia bacterium]